MRRKYLKAHWMFGLSLWLTVGNLHIRVWMSWHMTNLFCCSKGSCAKSRNLLQLMPLEQEFTKTKKRWVCQTSVTRSSSLLSTFKSKNSQREQKLWSNRNIYFTTVHQILHLPTRLPDRRKHYQSMLKTENLYTSMYCATACIYSRSAILSLHCQNGSHLKILYIPSIE